MSAPDDTDEATIWQDNERRCSRDPIAAWTWCVLLTLGLLYLAGLGWLISEYVT